MISSAPSVRNASRVKLKTPLIKTLVVIESRDMISIYRKRKAGSHWHFNTQCTNWPESDYIQVRFVQLTDGERFCEECTKREAEMFPSKE
jgi:hypothetical protein